MSRSGRFASEENSGSRKIRRLQTPRLDRTLGDKKISSDRDWNSGPAIPNSSNSIDVILSEEL